MTEAVADILSRVRDLSEQERADLAYALICSLDPEEDQDVTEIQSGTIAGQSTEGVFLTEAQKQDLQRRVAEIRSGQAVGKPAEQVFAELRKKRP